MDFPKHLEDCELSDILIHLNNVTVNHNIRLKILCDALEGLLFQQEQNS